jgi:proteasome lid subunit RPN8/RPN11
MMLILPDSERAHILVHAETCRPMECCGFLLGKRQGGSLRVVETLPAANITSGPDRYRIAPEGVLEAELHSRRRGLEVIAIYHSHRETDAFPSAVDRDEAIPGTVHLIAGRGELRAWALHASRRCDSVPIRSGTADPV